MAARSQRYDLLARLLDYPEVEGYPEKLSSFIEMLEDGYADAAATLRPLHDRVQGMSNAEIQEMYTRTFDINPVCTLEIGWHIYGEDYARGALLVKLREQLRLVNVTESCELPDHLTHVLMLLGRIDGEKADDLAARYVLPGLDKMLEGMAGDEQPYRALIETVSNVVRADHDVEVIVPREHRGDPPDWKNRMPVFGAQRCGGGEGRKQ
jgi:nitrate reductase assembly molybdenum cofactor insertion protein NarJ